MIKESPEVKYRNHADIQIRFNDIDPYGHVNNAVHQYYYDLGRLSYFKEVLNGDVDQASEYLMVVRVEVDYVNPVLLDEEIAVCTSIVSIGTKSVTLMQEIYEKSSAVVKSRSRSVMVAMDGRTNSSIEVPERWRKWISEFEMF
jgi:acyl-CoA thioester hydrolase